MKRAVALVVLFGLAGCGSDGKPPAKAVTTPTALAAPASTPLDPDSCDAKGITPGGGNTGSCTNEDGSTADVVKHDGTVELSDTTVRLVKSYVVKTVPALTTYGAPGAKARGRFVIFHFRVKNTTHKPLDWPSGLGQTALVLDGNTYSPSSTTAAFTFAYRLKGDPGQEGSTMIQPNETADGWSAFDVPTSAVSDLHKLPTSIDVVSPADAQNGYNAASGTAQRYGSIRLWQ